MVYMSHDIKSIKVKRYHAGNGRFSKQYFRSAIEDANHTITFRGVGYNNQNYITKRKIQTITLGYRTLILHAKIYCLEEITTILWPYARKAFL